MKLLTVMNYADPMGIRMCKAWIYFARRFNPEAEITILHGPDFGGIRPFIKHFNGIRCIPLPTDAVVPHTRMNKRKNGMGIVPSQDLTLAGWVAVERQGLHHFIFAEADAWILSDLSEWWQTSRSKPYIAVEESNFKGGPFYNSGVYSYCSPAGFITYDKLMEQYRIDGDVIAISIGDQGLLNQYFRRIGYDASHPKIDYEYNSTVVGCEVRRADDEQIEVWSGNRPDKIEGQSVVANWIGWDRPRRVRVLHSVFIPHTRPKFWAAPEAKPLTDYVDRKLAEIEA